MSYFSMGYWVVGLAALVSTVGALVGLICVRQSTESVTQKFRLVWQVAAAVCLGGVGTWLAVFVSMLGVAPTDDGVIRYESTRLVTAGVIAVVAVLGALLILGTKADLPRLGAAGLTMGLGTTIMLFVAMNGVHVRGSVRTAWWAVVVAALIAIAIATATLWFVLRRTPIRVLVAASVLFAVGTLGMHYVRLAGMAIELDESIARPLGDDLFGFLVPMFVLGMLSLAVPITAVLVAPDRRLRSTPTPTPATAQAQAFDAGETMVIGASRF
ncbi:MHYT domain-containing protein [Nocardia higoensis]|uniref:MHYT domain-containing protein n=1 Tax=Nocardia higoensis TaxID=228599 RepID=UPI0002F6A511|nr:MHYT domain-containing protein [Nocardia higoensis]